MVTLSPTLSLPFPGIRTLLGQTSSHFVFEFVIDFKGFVYKTMFQRKPYPVLTVQVLSLLRNTLLVSQAFSPSLNPFKTEFNRKFWSFSTGIRANIP